MRLLVYLNASHLSAWQLAVALWVAIVLGGLHAMTPGHGKTLVAADLVGSKGMVTHAASLGAIVTFTHIASVIVIGLIAFFSIGFFVLDVLVPALEVVSGALVVVMGRRLIWQRWTAFQAKRAHEHDHDHSDGRVHSRLMPDGFKIGSLIAMGRSGGLVPYLEALGVMIIAVGLNRILLGFGLIVSFSFALAAVLIGLGILLVRLRSLIERFGSRAGRLTTTLPLGSAVLVTVLGVGITLGGLSLYLH